MTATSRLKLVALPSEEVTLSLFCKGSVVWDLVGGEGVVLEGAGADAILEVGVLRRDLELEEPFLLF